MMPENGSDNQQQEQASAPEKFQDDLRRAQEAEQHYRQTNDAAALDDAIAAWERILDHPDFQRSGGSFQLLVLEGAADAHMLRYGHSGQLPDLDAALTLLQRVVDRLPPDAPDRPGYLDILGIGLSERYERTLDLKDLEAAIQAYRGALEGMPPDVQQRIMVLSGLSNALSERYARTHNRSDLDEAIGHLREALRLAPEGSPERPVILDNLAAALNDRYDLAGAPDDLEEAIRLYREAVAATPEDSPDRPARLNNLGTGLYDRYRRTGNLEDLDEAARTLREALAAMPQDSPDRPSRLDNLGNVLRVCYARTGDLEDLEEAIRLYREAVAATPPNSPELPSRLDDLSTGLYDRYMHTGRWEDLEEALRASRKAVAATPPDAVSRLPRLVNLSSILNALYLRTGRLEDLDGAIRALREALASAPQDSPGRAAVLDNLGNALYSRYLRTADPKELEEAIELHRQAMSAMPQGAPDRPKTLDNLGDDLRMRYIRSGDSKDLEEAIRLFRKAVDVSPSDSPDRPGFLANLGNGLRDLYALGGDLKDLEEAIRALREAVADTPPDSPYWPVLADNLGNVLQDRYERTGNPDDLKQAVAAFRRAYERGMRSNTGEALHAANNWLTGAFRRRAWDEVVRAYEDAVRATEARLSQQFEREDREISLVEAQGLASRAAFASWQLGDARRAVEILEHGRARLLREALERQRRDLHALAGAPYDSLYRAYVQAARTVGDLQSIPYGKRPADWEGRMARAQTALEEAVSAIRTGVPGFEHFLRSLPFAEIRAQAADAPLVYLAATDHGGIAAIVRGDGGPQVVESPGLTEESLQKQVLGVSTGELQALRKKAYKEKRRPPSWDDLLGGYLGAYVRWRANHGDEAGRGAWFDALEGSLAWLGEAVMGQVVEALQALSVPKGSVVRLVPGGFLEVLPLHAARLLDGSYALDHYTFTYAPSAQALYHARRAAQRPADSLLAVRYPDPGFELADQAVQVALDAFQEGECTPLLMKAATKSAIEEAFGDHAVLFFFTHGWANFDHPLQSGLLTVGDDGDVWLTLDEIMELRSEKARLAVLAACETGVPSDLRVLNEVVSLPSGLMQAGVPGVVGTLWSVAEASTAILVSIFFEEWRKNGLTPPQALRRAQQIVRDFHSDEESRHYFDRSPVPKAVADDFQVELMIEDFAHPFYWAAFTYTGL